MKKIFCIFVVLLIMSGQVFAQSVVECPSKSKRRKRWISPKTKTKIQYNGKKAVSKGKKVLSQIVQRVWKEGVTTIGPVLRERRYGEPEEVIKEEEKEEPVKIPIDGTVLKYRYVSESLRAIKDERIPALSRGTDLDRVIKKFEQEYEDENLLFTTVPKLPSQEKLEDIVRGTVKTRGDKETFQEGLYRVSDTEEGYIVREAESLTDYILDEKTGEISVPLELSDGKTTSVEIKYWVALVGYSYRDVNDDEYIKIMRDQVLLIAEAE